MHTSMRALRFALFGVACIGACSGGGGGGGGQGAFRLIEFLDSNVAGIARNHVVTFLFSAPVDAGQNFPERLKIQSVEAGPSSDFTLAIGTYLISGDRVTFLPRLPNAADRSDTGFRADANYEVFLKAGPDGLASTSGDRIAAPQEFSFVTSQYFEDMVPGGPPRVLGLEARDPVTGDATDIGRLDPRPTELALLDSAALISGVRFIDPAAGGPPDYPRAWDFVLHVSEPLDPLSVDTHSVEMFEIFSDATTSAADAPPDAPPGFTGNPVLFPVPLKVRTQQGFDANGHTDVRIVVTPVYTLVDDTRYRLRFSGSIVGIDFRQQFIGVNGLTGDGETVISGSTPYPEPGGLGYTTEFIVRDRQAITAKRTLTYDPLVDGVDPELGQTTTNPNNLNSALYDPAAGPGTAVGYLAAFGNGTDGNLAVGTGTVTIDTGDTANAAVGKPFGVFDVNPINDYNANTLPGGTLNYDSKKPFTLNLQSLTVSTGSTLRFIGVNPVLLRVTGVSQIAGTIDLSGQDGKNGLNGTVAGGVAGPGGGIGGSSKRGPSCTVAYITISNCAASTFAAAMTAGCGANWPWSLNGTGPGRGQAGGSAFGYMYWSPTAYEPQSGTGGGGGSRATSGNAGSDITSATAAAGTAGNCSGTTYTDQNSGVVGVRGRPGPVHGDAELFDVTWGGSGGGAGGATSEYYTYGAVASGGSGGGGGGMFTLASAGAILCTGGRIDVSGGNGGAGGYGQYVWYTTYGYYMLSGGGGGGSGGGICLISGDNITASATVFDATGGIGGAAPNNPSNNSTNANAGGAGGKGFIYLMDADGTISGLLPGTSGTYPTFAAGYLKIAPLSAGANRFGAIQAVTELFSMSAANPAYLPLQGSDILAKVSSGQQILIYASSAKANTANPLQPNLVTEIPQVLVARAHFALGATQIDTSYNAMDQLNPTGPNRDAYVRINALFSYGNVVEAALGPFAYIDRMDITYSFNG